MVSSKPRMATEKIKVLIQQPILPPYRLATFRALSQDPRLDVTIAYGTTTKGMPLESVENPEGIKTISFPNIAFGSQLAINIQPKIWKIFRQIQPDAVVFELNPRNLTSVILPKIFRRKGASITFWGHGIRPKERIKLFYEKQTKWADSTLLYYPQGKDELIKLGVPAEKLFVAWNSIETEEIATLAEPYTAVRNEIVTVCRLTPLKKVPLLLKAFLYATEHLGLDAKLTIIGDGPERAMLEELRNSSSHKDRINILGPLWKQTDIAPYFNRAYISVSAGQVGLNAIHCMAYGVPMICADNEPHSPEVMALKEGENAYFFTANSVEALAHKLVEAKNNPQQRFEFSKNAYDYTHANFSAQKMANNIAEAIIAGYQNRNKK